MRQRAAREAAEQGNPALAAKLSLQARRHAVKALETSGTPLERDLARVEPAEKALADRADDAEHDVAMEEAEKRTPPASELLREPAAVELQAGVEALLRRSATVLEQARAAAREGGKEKTKFRGAWMRQQAARQAFEAGRLRMAAKFGLQVRKLAFKVVEGNGGPIDPHLVETPAEKALKQPVEDAPDAEYDYMLAKVERRAPTAEELLR
ncbi:MAG: hypothetical protein ACYTEZ_15025 [Planctomycetota bacterium]|jgi:hypothetical protein